MFKSKDIVAMRRRDIAPAVAQEQIANFISGFPALDIDRAATVGDGIKSLDPEQAEVLARSYDKMVGKGMNVQKFVPASGAATRMFKDLFEYVNENKTSHVATETVVNIDKFAFVDDLRAAGIDFSDSKALAGSIILDPLNYGRLPKGLVKFHNYKEGARTALEEHLVEGAHYGLTCGKPVDIHFTVSPEHMDLFKARIAECIDKYQSKFGVTYNISYSIQKSSTDTIAVTPDNEPFRTGDGELLFRPSGHGALLENLADLDADLIFVKTIDNVQPDHLKGATILYKKALGSMAMSLQEQIFAYIRSIDRGDADPEAVIAFIESNLGYRLGKSTNFDQLRDILNRPLRVCGMVRNEGEPGGGPFWIKELGGVQSLQIAESSQICEDQKNLMKEATHFNPVDLVCMPRDVNGQKFNLPDFRDPKTGFISEKSSEGRPLKAQELPGLWNGAMAHWNTMFVEVPISTFSPVKTIVDLLRPEHQ